MGEKNRGREAGGDIAQRSGPATTKLAEAAPVLQWVVCVLEMSRFVKASGVF